MAQWFLQKQIDEISAEIRALRASVYNVDGAIDESNPLAVKAKALEAKLDSLQQLLASGDAKVTFPTPQEVTLTGTTASAYESLTVGSSAIALTAATYGAASRALITVENAPLRFRFDGANPSASNGHLAQPGDQVLLASTLDIAGFRAIRSTSVSATIRVTYSGV